MGGGAAGGHHPVAERLQPDDLPAAARDAATWCWPDARSGLHHATGLRREHHAPLPAPRRSRRPSSRRWKASTQAISPAGWRSRWSNATAPKRAFDGGLHIKTTLNLELQKAAEQAVERYLPGPEGPTSSLVVIENSTGEVRAMVGGPNYAESPFNLATEGERQPGSAFKAFDLAAALEAASRPTRCGPPSRRNSSFPTREGRNASWCTTTKAPTPAEHADRRDGVLGQLDLRGSGPEGGHAPDRGARPSHGHHDATVDQPGDDDRRPDGRRDAAGHGARV